MTVPVGPADAGTGRGVPGAALVAARAADEKLGEATVVLAMGELLGVTDAFVITNGRNSRQVRTLVDEIERRVKEVSGRAPRAVEGLRDLHWVLMDYGDFLVHVFHEDTRPYYDLEHLWADAPRVSWSDTVPRSASDA
ncbi:MAG TPA: ribosome silencing factor [Acidimicrobiales bacterium]|nr:ribosome silencing factor [Acidimicrobiales bacterium]